MKRFLAFIAIIGASFLIMGATTKVSQASSVKIIKPPVLSVMSNFEYGICKNATRYGGRTCDNQGVAYTKTVYTTRKNAKKICEQVKSLVGQKKTLCVWDNPNKYYCSEEALGYQLYWNDKRVGYEPSWSKRQGKSNCEWNLDRYPYKDVDCEFNYSYYDEEDEEFVEHGCVI